MPESPPMSTPANTNGRETVARSAPVVRIKCPHCGRVTTAEDSLFVQSPEAPVPRVKVACPAGHWLIPHPEPGESRWSGR
jgi:hypothetical protein